MGRVVLAPTVIALALSACGRVDFNASSDGGGTILIVTEVHHLGDNSVGSPPYDPEGLTFSRSFTLPKGCTRGVLDVDFPGPFGPYRDNLPIVSINQIVLAELRPQFPPDDDPRWLNGNWDYQPPLLVSLDTGIALRNGDNVFTLVDGGTTDDFFFDGVALRCF